MGFSLKKYCLLTIYPETLLGELTALRISFLSGEVIRSSASINRIQSQLAWLIAKLRWSVKFLNFRVISLTFLSLDKNSIVPSLLKESITIISSANKIESIASSICLISL